MSQATTGMIERNDLMYSVKLSYYGTGINDQGLMVEQLKPNQEIKLYRLQRRNIAHSKLGLALLRGNEDELTLAMEFVRCCVVDEKVSAELLGDAMACIELACHEAVKEDVQRFFEGWEYYQTLTTPRSKNE